MDGMLVFAKGKEYEVYSACEDRIIITQKPNEHHVFSTSPFPNDINPMFYGDYFDKLIELDNGICRT